MFFFGMYRLCNVTKLNNEIILINFGFTSVPIASECFKLFILHMINNWGYLLTNNFDWWVNRLPMCAWAIRRKAAELGLHWPPDEIFTIAAFTDNTMEACCRPGGGPAAGGGRDAPRNDPNLQRAWYNGWKKLHGLKFQTVDLPNGMNAPVWGPFSVRHTD